MDFGLPSCCLSCWPNKPGIPFSTSPQLHTEWCMSLVRNNVLSYHHTQEKDKAYLMSLKKAPEPGCPGKGCRLQEWSSAHCSEGWFSERHGWNTVSTHPGAALCPPVASPPAQRHGARPLKGSVLETDSFSHSQKRMGADRIWAAPADSSPHTGTGTGSTSSWGTGAAPARPTRLWDSTPGPSGPRTKGRGEQGLGLGFGSPKGISRGTRRRYRNEEAAVGAGAEHRPRIAPELDGAVEAGRPRGAPRGPLRSSRTLPGAEPRERGRGRLLPAVGFSRAAAQHTVYMLHYCTRGLTLSPGIHLT